MGLFPKIDKPCPYKENLDSVMDGNVCLMCERNVYNLNHMAEAERQDFLANCQGEVCVSYKLPIKQLITGALIASASTSLAVSAADISEVIAEVNDYNTCEEVIMVGGIRKADEAVWIDPSKELHLSDIPVKELLENSDKSIELIEFALNGATKVIEAETDPSSNVD